MKVQKWPKPTIAAGRRHTVALKSDSTVVAVGDSKYGQCEVGDWCDIVDVAAGNVHMATNTGHTHTVGLKADGTVFASGWNKHGQCEVSDWRGMVSIAAGWRHTIGVKANGSVKWQSEDRSSLAPARDAGVRENRRPHHAGVGA
jgi:alpha-tubulin suppressor-like RCC1 family protein